MRRKSAFNQGHFWENLGMFVFMAAGLAGPLVHDDERNFLVGFPAP